MCECVCICMNGYVRVCVCLYVYVCLYMYVCVCVSVSEEGRGHLERSRGTLPFVISHFALLCRWRLLGSYLCHYTALAEGGWGLVLGVPASTPHPSHDTPLAPLAQVLPRVSGSPKIRHFPCIPLSTAYHAAYCQRPPRNHTAFFI